MYNFTFYIFILSYSLVLVHSKLHLIEGFRTSFSVHHANTLADSCFGGIATHSSIRIINEVLSVDFAPRKSE